MKVLLLNQYFPPDEAATAQMLGDLVESLCVHGMSCEVVTSNRSYADPARRYPRRGSWRGARVRRIAMTGFGRRSKLGRLVDYATFLAGATLRLLTAKRPDVIIGLSTPPILGALAVAVGRLRRVRSAYWTMDVYPDVAFELGAVSRQSLAGRVFATVSRWALRSADTVVALGETMAERLKALGARNIVTIPNWADGEAVRPMPAEASRYRRERQWTGKFVVLYSGNLGLAHEFESALGAAERLQESDGIVLAFVGVGPRLAELMSEVRRRGLSNVEFHPPVPRERLNDSLAAGDLHLVTLRPGMPGLLVPSKIYGILAAGRPTLYVGPAEGEVFDIVSRGACGSWVDNADPEELARVILAYREDGDRRAREGCHARQLFEAKFTRQRSTDAFRGLIETLGSENDRTSGTPRRQILRVPQGDKRGCDA
jgi:colanic acid biosynthesis glycosyl transferase WcaI